MTPEQLFADLCRTDPSRPFVTYYDEATGHRVELSIKSLANWVAKTHFLLTDELGLGVGDTALIRLAPHWIAYPVLLGCLTAGLSVAAADADSADVAFVDAAGVSGTGDTDGTESAGIAGIPDVYAVAGDAAAAGLAGTAPEGAANSVVGSVADYVAAVRPQPDAWGGVRLTATDGDPFSGDLSRGDAVRRAADLARSRGLERGARILTTADWHGVDDWVAALLVPLAVSGSVVLVRNSPAAEVIGRRASQERVDAIWS